MFIRGHYHRNLDIIDHSSVLAKKYSMGKNTHEKSPLHKWFRENFTILNEFNFSSWEDAIKFVICFTDHI